MKASMTCDECKEIIVDYTMWNFVFTCTTYYGLKKPHLACCNARYHSEPRHKNTKQGHRSGCTCKNNERLRPCEGDLTSRNYTVVDSIVYCYHPRFLGFRKTVDRRKKKRKAKAQQESVTDPPKAKHGASEAKTMYTTALKVLGCSPSVKSLG